MKSRVRGGGPYLALVALISLGCGADEGADDYETPASSASMQGRVPKKMREIVDQPKLVERGKEVYANCLGCHGADGGGVIGAGPRLNSDTFLAAAADELLIHTVEHGREGTTMIAWGQQFPKSDVYAVVAYIRSWSDVEAVTLDERPLAGDLTRGQEIFSSICAGCHGAHGGGYQESANGTGIGRKAFLAAVSNGYLRYIIKHGKSGTKMRPFAEGSKVAVANLDDQQIEDVIVFLRASAW